MCECVINLTLIFCSLTIRQGNAGQETRGNTTAWDGRDGSAGGEVPVVTLGIFLIVRFTKAIEGGIEDLFLVHRMCHRTAKLLVIKGRVGHVEGNAPQASIYGLGYTDPIGFNTLMSFLIAIVRVQVIIGVSYRSPSFSIDRRNYYAFQGFEPVSAS